MFAEESWSAERLNQLRIFDFRFENAQPRPRGFKSEVHNLKSEISSSVLLPNSCLQGKSPAIFEKTFADMGMEAFFHI
jgi:hypothetical protein